MPTLSTTSYAILGLLSLRSWTTYELAEQMRRALGQFWPRAESGIYTEPKKLVELGFAKATEELVGKRPRMRYEITAAGRKELKKWVPLPGAGPVIEFEQLVKIFFAEQATKSDLLAAIRRVKTDNEDYIVATSAPSADYLEERGSYPERLPWLVVCGKFLEEMELAIDRWATWAEKEIEAWPDDIREAQPAWDTLRQMEAHAQEFRMRVAARD